MDLSPAQQRLLAHAAAKPHVKTHVGVARVGWPFWRRWVLATAVGWGLAVACLFVPAVTGGYELGTLQYTQGFGAIVLTYTLMGLLVGLSQWLVLRAHLRHAAAWIAATTAGMGLGPFASTVFGPSSVEFDLYSAWVLVGLLQWWLVRGSFAQGLIWLAARGLMIVVTVRGAILLLFVMGALVNQFAWPWLWVLEYLPRPVFEKIMEACTFCSLGLPSGVIMGATLVWLLNQGEREIG